MKKVIAFEYRTINDTPIYTVLTSDPCVARDEVYRLGYTSKDIGLFLKLVPITNRNRQVFRINVTDGLIKSFANIEGSLRQVRATARQMVERRAWREAEVVDLAGATLARFVTLPGLEARVVAASL